MGVTDVVFIVAIIILMGLTTNKLYPDQWAQYMEFLHVTFFSATNWTSEKGCVTQLAYGMIGVGIPTFLTLYQFSIPLGRFVSYVCPPLPLFPSPYLPSIIA